MQNVESSNLPQTQEISFAKLRDGTTLDLIEDPHNPDRTLLAVFKDGRVIPALRLKKNGRIYYPLGRRSNGLVDVRLPRGVLPYDSADQIACDLIALISKCVVVSDSEKIILASFILYTWFADSLATAVYLSIVGPPSSGKTTLLEFLHLFCRRPLLVSDITPAGTCDACSRLGSTLLIDEFEQSAGQMTGPRLQLLRAGTTPGVLARRIRWAGHSFGPKVFSSIEPINDLALRSRCIEIRMTEVSTSDLLRPTDPWMKKFADETQRKLLQLRFEKYNTMTPAAIPGAEELRPRLRDLLCTLAAPLAGWETWTEGLLKIFQGFHASTIAKLLSMEQQAAVAILFIIIHQRGIRSIRVGELTGRVNNFFESTGENLQLKPRGMGHVLTSLGLPREHDNRGCFLPFILQNQRRIHDLAQKSGYRFINTREMEKNMAGCEMCQKEKNVA